MSDRQQKADRRSPADRNQSFRCAVSPAVVAVAFAAGRVPVITVTLSTLVMRHRTPNAVKTGDCDKTQPERYSNTREGNQHRLLLLADLLATHNKNVLSIGFCIIADRSVTHKSSLFARRPTGLCDSALSSAYEGLRNHQSSGGLADLNEKSRNRYAQPACGFSC